jgi:uncharacterized protein
VTARHALRWLAVVAFCAAGAASAQQAIPPLTARVTDQTGTLTRPQAAALEQRLQAFEAKKGSQIAVLMVPSTGEETIEQYAIRAAEQWKLGRKGVDDGALLVVAKNDRALRIEVGYGLEGALNDATAKRIISEVIVPHFKEGDFYGGIAAGVERIMAVAEGEPLPAPRPVRQGNADVGQYLPVLFVVVLFVVALVAGGLLRALFGRFLGAAATGGIAAWLAWAMAGALSMALLAGGAVFLFTLLSGFGRRSTWGPGLGGFGGFGGGSSGGFRGGGGDFGGGGASGRW